MNPSGYAFATYGERRPDVESVTRLTQRAFAEYPGVIAADQGFTEWFLARPGFDSGASWAAWLGATLVGSLFLARVPLSLDGRWAEVGIVDTVMVSPEHRGRGLARSLMERSIASCRAAGVEMMQLYTAPGSAGYRLYTSLGFEERHRLRYWRRPSARHVPPAASWREVSEDALDEAGQLLQSLAGSHDGVPRQSDELRRWRWLRRPPGMPAKVWAREDGSEAALAVSTPVCLTDGRCVALLKDLVACDAPSLVALSVRVAARECIAVADVGDASLSQALTEAGFEPGQEEAAMLLPLIATGAVERRSRPWFPLTESIIGA